MKAAGKLGALMFSGTATEGPYGEWTDLHTPFAPFCPESLLTVESAKELFNVADTAKLQFAGIKLLEIDANADANHRIAILRDGVTALNKARQ